jgi:hypothetical protein
MPQMNDTGGMVKCSVCWYWHKPGEPCGCGAKVEQVDLAPPPVQRALDRQVGGDHYKSMAIQPVQFALENNLGFCEGNVVKYVVRRKGNRIEDLKKARHYLDLLIEFEEGRDGA